MLPEALRLLMIKSDGLVLVHADTGGYKPQNCAQTLLTRLKPRRGPWRAWPSPSRLPAALEAPGRPQATPYAAGRIGVGSWLTNPMEVLAMHVVVQHRITDPEKFSAMDPADVGGGAPSGAQVQQFFPYKDGSAAVCLWETQSIDRLRDYLDPLLAGVTENAYFEVDGETAMGLPETAAAGA